MHQTGYDYAAASVMLNDLVNEIAINETVIQEDPFASASADEDDRAGRLIVCD